MSSNKPSPHTARHSRRVKRRKAATKNTYSKVGKIGIAKTLKAAIAMTKLPLNAVQTAKDKGCSAFRANGTVDCDELLDFVLKMPQPTEAVPDYYLERALDIQANRKLKEQKFREREKLVWPIEKIRRDWTRNIIATKTKLTVAENSIATEAGMRLGLNTDQITTLREITMKHIRTAQKELHSGEWGKTECPNCKQEIT